MRDGHGTSHGDGDEQTPATPGWPAGARSPAGFRVSYPAMLTPQGPRRRTRSAFAAAFLSLLFPGLGHAYAGASMRALGFAALPLLAIALLLGVVTRMDRLELIGSIVSRDALTAIFVLNIALALYRIAAAIDAWRVAHFLNSVDASGTGRLGRVRLPMNPLSIAGLGAVILVLLGGHAVVARYDMLALSLVDCVFQSEDTAACTAPDASPDASSGASVEPVPSDGSASPSDLVPTPIATPSGSAAQQASIPPWDGKERLNVLLVGTDQRPKEGTYNTDTMIVLSIDPQTRRVAMFQLPRDAADLPVPPQARSVWGSVYTRKVNSWFTANRQLRTVWPGINDRARGMNALKAMLGGMYGLDIKYYVEVDFQGFVKVVDTLGGVNINVQNPLSDDHYPAENNVLRRLYVPAGPQHMTGTQALAYARSRKTTDDFDRGRRQQRVLLSLREQTDVGSVLSKLPELINALKKSVRTDIPTAELPKLLGLANSIDTRNVRSFVFAPSFYATQYLNSAIGYKIVPNIPNIRRAVANAFTGDPQIEERRQVLGNEGARVWVLNGSGKDGQASAIAGFMLYNGIDASAPRQRVQNRPPDTRIVVYNGAESKLDGTIAFLESLFKVKATMRTDDSVGVDIMVTTGARTPDLVAPAAG